MVSNASTQCGRWTTAADRARTHTDNWLTDTAAKDLGYSLLHVPKLEILDVGCFVTLEMRADRAPDSLFTARQLYQYRWHAMAAGENW